MMFLTCGWCTCNVSIAWELFRNVTSQTLPQIYWISISGDGLRSLLTSTSGDSLHNEAKRRGCFIYIKWTVGDDFLFIYKNYFIFEHIIFLLESCVLCLLVVFWALCSNMNSETQSDQLRIIIAESFTSINQDVYNQQSKNYLDSRSDLIES